MSIFSDEIIERAKQAKSADEFLALAEENGIELTAEEAKASFEQLHESSNELDDEQLEQITGGMRPIASNNILTEIISGSNSICNPNDK